MPFSWICMHFFPLINSLSTRLPEILVTFIRESPPPYIPAISRWYPSNNQYFPIVLFMDMTQISLWYDLDLGGWWISNTKWGRKPHHPLGDLWWCPSSNPHVPPPTGLMSENNPTSIIADSQFQEMPKKHSNKSYPLVLDTNCHSNVTDWVVCSIVVLFFRMIDCHLIFFLVHFFKLVLKNSIPIGLEGAENFLNIRWIDNGKNILVLHVV